MKYKVSYFLIFALALSSVLMAGVTVQAKKPLRGTSSLVLDLTGYPHLTGTISGDISGNFKGYLDLNRPPKMVGNVMHFWEIWEIWSTGGELLIKAESHTVVTPANGKVRGNAVITQTATSYEQYTHWFAMGSLDGTIFTGILRIS
jgi:hypothetical protein